MDIFLSFIEVLNVSYCHEEPELVVLLNSRVSI